MHSALHTHLSFDNATSFSALMLLLLHCSVWWLLGATDEGFTEAGCFRFRSSTRCIPSLPTLSITAMFRAQRLTPAFVFAAAVFTPLLTTRRVALTADESHTPPSSTAVVAAPPTVTVAAAGLKRKYRVGVLGATGTVGQQFVKHLQSVTAACASARSHQ